MKQRDTLAPKLWQFDGYHGRAWSPGRGVSAWNRPGFSDVLGQGGDKEENSEEESKKAFHGEASVSA
jgi:hypothetical protein